MALRLNAQPRDTDYQDTVLMTRDNVAAIRNNCPRRDQHRTPPAGMAASWDWFEEMHKTHRQQQCECGLWLLWVRRDA